MNIYFPLNRLIKVVIPIVALLGFLVFLIQRNYSNHTASNNTHVNHEVIEGDINNSAASSKDRKLGKKKFTNNVSEPIKQSLKLWDTYGAEGRSAAEVRSLRDSLVGALVQHGYPPELIYDLIDQSYDDGDNRNRLISRLFDYLSPEQAQKVFMGLKQAERQHALANMMTQLLGAKVEIPEYLKSLNITENEEDAFYSVYLRTKYMSLYRRDGIAKQDAILEVMSMPASASVRQQFYMMALKDDPFDVYAAMQVNSKLFNSDGNIVVSAMLARDPERTRDAVLKDQSLTQELKTVTEFMLDRENASFVKWLESYKSQLSPIQLNYVEAGFAQHLATDEKILDAWNKVNQISDPTIKKQAEGQVWAKEREMVQNSVNKDPQQAITELVSGKSQHDAYWIEEAMDVWMTKDFDKAEQWYQDNWKSLPAEKSQYAAAAFAKQAIRAGDIDAATQWLPFIQDPKTKARIEGELQRERQEINK